MELTRHEWRKFDFQSRKFKELILYFSKRGLEEGLVIGSTKLNKLLFFTDFRAYAELGSPVTGATYQKLQFGPAARELLPMRDELLKDQEIRFRDQASDDLNDVLVPLSKPKVNEVLSDAERKIADDVFEELRPFNATAVSDYSHLKSAGWNVVDFKDDIPYESAFVVTDPPPAEAIQLGRELAAKFGW
ncbi:MAG TPA: Panacea domain-containing protein [Gaiellaceae bacterium]|nr:Panacea domain-containing protein [Gaiellaceae bacterium]